MGYLDKFRTFFQSAIDKAESVEKVNEFNEMLNEVTTREEEHTNLLNEYKRLINNHEVEKTTDYCNMTFEEMLHEFSKEQEQK